MLKLTQLNPARIIFSLGALLAFSPLNAAEHEVKMLNTGVEGAMVFEPGYLKVDAGDTVKFISVDAGHNTVSFASPEGGESWDGAIGEEVSVTFNSEGVYLYKCVPHAVLAMVGVIQVGAASNLDEATKAADDFSATLAVNKERLGKYMSQVQ